MRKTTYRYGNKASQVGDLYKPVGIEKPALVILIHGGYWKDNHDRNSYATYNLISPLLEKGLAVWNLEYRRMEYEGENITAAWPGLLADVGAGIDFARTLSTEENLDLERTLLIGHSAGGHLATWAVSRQNIAQDSPLYCSNPLSVKRMVSIAGVMDFSIAQDVCLAHIERLVGGNYATYSERFQAADPKYLQDGIVVPQLIIHGLQDDCVDIDQARSYVKDSQNKNLRYVEWSDGDHFSMLLEPGQKNWPDLLALLDEEIALLG